MANTPPLPPSQQPPPLSLLPPPSIVVHGVERDPLDSYLKSWAITQGYEIVVAHSSQDGKMCQYGCHRGGKPRTKKKINPTTTEENDTSSFQPIIPTRSIKIGCEFKLVARFNTEAMTWTFVQKNNEHSHDAEEITAPAKARKKFKKISMSDSVVNETIKDVRSLFPFARQNL